MDYNLIDVSLVQRRPTYMGDLFDWWTYWFLKCAEPPHRREEI